MSRGPEVWVFQGDPCGVVSCDLRAVCRGWCDKHYQRWRAHGDPEFLLIRDREIPAPCKPKIIRPKFCVVKDCKSQSRTRGWCNLHYARWKRYGSVHTSKIVRGEFGEECWWCGNDLPNRTRTRFCGGRCRTVAINTQKEKWHKETTKICPDCKSEYVSYTTRGPKSARCDGCFQEYDRIRNLEDEQIRRALKAGVTIEDFSNFDIFERDLWICQICLDQVDPDLRWPHLQSATLDHVIPLSRGGDHSMSNTQLAHLTCNCQKHTREGFRLVREVV
jgi:5-methylcytosine-specific restriction endonuclease McrA